MKSILCLSLALAIQGVLGFPAVLENQLEDRALPKGCRVSKQCNTFMHVSNRQIGYKKNKPTEAQKASKALTNCGAANGPCTVFDAEEQFVSTTGQHAYRSPSITEIRGPCPGLNAAANHDYLPRSGVAGITETIDGLAAAFAMGPDVSGFLAAYAIGLDGDILTMQWSIGGPAPTLQLPLLRQGQGISWSHNKYEGDTSIGRCDAYMNGGDAHSLSPVAFSYAYASGMDNDRYTLDKFARAFTKNTIRSVSRNPLYFAPLFSTTIVSPAAYNFVINFMSNRTATEKSGYLDGKQFKQWFAMRGEYPNFKWLPGQERIPDNWYRRPSSQPYTVPGVFADVINEFRAYPKSFRFGGNTGGTNTYTGIDLANFTNGVITADNLLEGNNLACFFFQNQQQAVPDQLKSGLNEVAKRFELINSALSDSFGALQCPQIGKYDTGAFDSYPGRNYSPKPKAGTPTNC